MKNNGFYNSIAYKERQSEITRNNWQIGIYDFLRKQEKRQCANTECGRWFEAKPAESKKFCSRKCAAQVNNSKRSNIPSNTREVIARFYQDGLSMQEISDKTGWKYGKVVYWMRKFNIPRRSRSEANYIKYNPKGDPFKIKKHLTKEEKELKGLGVGLYWGEGNKRIKWAVKLGNTDSHLIKKFIEFLIKICGVKKEKIKYALQVFNDADVETAINFWVKELKLSREKLGKVLRLPSRGKGTYKIKNQYGVFSVYVHNIKLKNQLDEWIREIIK